jgi:hypothetical protein
LYSSSLSKSKRKAVGLVYNLIMNLDQFSFEQDDRRYINPQTALDESNAFIDNLRSVQQQGSEEIAQDTYNLGTQVPSNLGGLVGGEGYFRSRYQTPQTNAIVSDLRAAAQAQALNEAMNNELAIAKQKYNNAYKAAQKRARSRSGGGGGGVTPYAPNTGFPDNVVEEDVPENEGAPFWSSSVSDDAVYYGLYKLNRNPGESQKDWDYRSQSWLKEMDLKNSWRAK